MQEWGAESAVKPSCTRLSNGAEKTVTNFQEKNYIKRERKYSYDNGKIKKAGQRSPDEAGDIRAREGAVEAG